MSVHIQGEKLLLVVETRLSCLHAFQMHTRCVVLGAKTASGDKRLALSNHCSCLPSQPSLVSLPLFEAMSGEEPTSVHVQSQVRLEGLPKSGRFWKKKQVFRSSAQCRKGVLSHLATSFEEKKEKREKIKAVKELEKEMKEEKQRQKEEAKKRREEQEKRRLANEFKTTTFQVVSISLLLVHTLKLKLILSFSFI
jgi:hypothetical protein